MTPSWPAAAAADADLDRSAFPLAAPAPSVDARLRIGMHHEDRERVLADDVRRGLRAPQVSLPSSGPAVFETELKKLRGAYDVIVAKPNRETNEFSINVSDKFVTVNKGPVNKFVEIVTIEEDW